MTNNCQFIITYITNNCYYGGKKMLNRRLLDSKMALKGTTQRSLAKYLKKSEVVINKKFQGYLKFSVDDISKIKDYLNLTNDEVVEIFINE